MFGEAFKNHKMGKGLFWGDRGKTGCKPKRVPFLSFLLESLSLALTSAYQVLGVASVKAETCGLSGSVKNGRKDLGIRYKGYTTDTSRDVCMWLEKFERF